MKTLILGGVKSGKSRLAEQMACGYEKEHAMNVCYIATASNSNNDDEMKKRIAVHRAQRPAHWALAEEPQELAATLKNHAAENTCLLVDCLTLWLCNLLCSEDHTCLNTQRDAFLETLPKLTGNIILVSNETNMGIIPINKLSRQFCDHAGVLHQQLAQLCDRVIIMHAGLPQILKGAAL